MPIKATSLSLLGNLLLMLALACQATSPDLRTIVADTYEARRNELPADITCDAHVAAANRFFSYEDTAAHMRYLELWEIEARIKVENLTDDEFRRLVSEANKIYDEEVISAVALLMVDTRWSADEFRYCRDRLYVTKYPQQCTFDTGRTARLLEDPSAIDFGDLGKYGFCKDFSLDYLNAE